MNLATPILRKNLLALADAYVAATGRTMEAVARAAHGDPPFFDRLRNGDGFTTRKHDDVLKWFDQNWPKGVERPALESYEPAPKKPRRKP